MTDDFANIVSFYSILRMVFTTEDKALIKNLYLLKGSKGGHFEHMLWLLTVPV